MAAGFAAADDEGGDTSTPLDDAQPFEYSGVRLGSITYKGF